MTQDPPERRSSSFGRYSPEGAEKFTAQRLSDGRRFGVCSGVKPRCVAGHLFRPKDPDSFRGFRLDFFGRCQYREARGGQPCDVLNYMYRMGEDCLFVVEANAAILKQASETAIVDLEMFGLIGLLLPGVPLDLGAQAMKDSRDPEAFKEFQRRNAEEAERRARDKDARHE